MYYIINVWSTYHTYMYLEIHAAADYKSVARCPAALIFFLSP